MTETTNIRAAFWSTTTHRRGAVAAKWPCHKPRLQGLSESAQSAGPAWHIEIEGNIIRLFQGEPPVANVAEPEFARGLGIVP